MVYDGRGRWRRTSAPILGWAVFLACACVSPQVAAGSIVNLELILAVDVSGSMTKAELLLQRGGYISALRSSDIAAAVERHGAVALAYLEWAGPNEQRIVVPWTTLRDRADAGRFADKLADAPLDPGFKSAPWETGTSISGGILFAANMFSGGSFAGRTIDISGDGPNNSGRPLTEARAYVVARGITINGLPMINPLARSDRPLGSYYENWVIGGPGAFSIAVHDPSLFEYAIRRKLVLEIAGVGPPVIPANFVPAAAAGRSDCDVTLSLDDQATD